MFLLHSENWPNIRYRIFRENDRWFVEAHTQHEIFRLPEPSNPRSWLTWERAVEAAQDHYHLFIDISSYHLEPPC